jgi:hypothetical protein
MSRVVGRGMLIRPAVEIYGVGRQTGARHFVRRRCVPAGGPGDRRDWQLVERCF